MVDKSLICSPVILTIYVMDLKNKKVSHHSTFEMDSIKSLKLYLNISVTFKLEVALGIPKKKITLELP